MPAYPIEFKKKAVHAANNRGDKTFAEVADKLGIATVTLASWRAALDAEIDAAGIELPKPNGHATNDERPALPLLREIKKNLEHVDTSEVARLRAENAELRSLLKKLL